MFLEKKCSCCNLVKPSRCFAKSSSTNDGLQSYCKDCKYQVNWKNSLKKDFGMMPEDFENISLIQDESCGICGVHQRHLEKKLCVDHDHETGFVRGLLCSTCNLALGIFGDNLQGIQRASSYLQHEPYTYKATHSIGDNRV